MDSTGDKTLFKNSFTEKDKEIKKRYKALKVLGTEMKKQKL